MLFFRSFYSAGMIVESAAVLSTCTAGGISESMSGPDRPTRNPKIMTPSAMAAARMAMIINRSALFFLTGRRGPCGVRPYGGCAGCCWGVGRDVGPTNGRFETGER